MKDLLKRISVDPRVCHGKACIKGTRIMVSQVIEFLANGDAVEDILEAYPKLTRRDVQACLAYAAEMTRDRYIVLR